MKDANFCYPQFYSPISWCFNHYYPFSNTSAMISSDMSFYVTIRRIEPLLPASGDACTWSGMTAQRDRADFKGSRSLTRTCRDNSRRAPRCRWCRARPSPGPDRWRSGSRSRRPAAAGAALTQPGESYRQGKVFGCNWSETDRQHWQYVYFHGCAHGRNMGPQRGFD